MALFKGKRGDAEEAEAAPAGRPAPSPVPLPPAQRSERVDPRKEKGGSSPMANIGKSISIKGDVAGDEDTVIEGRVEGRVSLKNHHLTVGANGDVQGEVSGKQVTIVGKVSGNVVASERVEVRESGQIQGDLISPRLLVAEGATINGAITMKVSGPGAQPTRSSQSQAQGQSKSPSGPGQPSKAAPPAP